jgi:hypothetical protein
MSFAQGAGLDIRFSHDFGEVSDTNQIVYQFKLGNTNNETIKTIFRTCGCTTVNLSEGDVIQTNSAVTIAISLEGKSFGKGNQTVGIETTDGKNYHFDLAYKYYPKPFSKPMAVVFSSWFEKKQVQLFFPEEEQIKFVSQEPRDCPITAKVLYNGSHFIWLGLSLVKEKKMDLPHEGVLTVITTSKIRPKIAIPYLVFQDKD